MMIAAAITRTLTRCDFTFVTPGVDGLGIALCDNLCHRQETILFKSRKYVFCYLVNGDEKRLFSNFERRFTVCEKKL